MNQPLTLGSLFDGIGGFCLAGQYAGVKPLWSSEIEPFPVRVTEKRFPDVFQLGDVHGIDGGAGARHRAVGEDGEIAPGNGHRRGQEGVERRAIATHFRTARPSTLASTVPSRRI